MHIQAQPCSHAAPQKVPELAQEQGEPALRMHFSGGLTRSRPGPEAEIQKLEPGSRPEIQIVQSQKKSAPKPAKNPDSQQINPEAGPKSRPKKNTKNPSILKNNKKNQHFQLRPPWRVSARIRAYPPAPPLERIRAYPRVSAGPPFPRIRAYPRVRFPLKTKESAISARIRGPPPGAYPRVSARIRRPRPERVSARIRAYPRFCCFPMFFHFLVCVCVFGSVF